MSTSYLIFIDDIQFKNIYENTFAMNEKVAGTITWLAGRSNHGIDNNYQFIGAFASKIKTWKKTWNEWDELVTGIAIAIDQGYSQQCVIRAVKTATTTVCVPHVYIFLYFCIYIKYNWCVCRKI